MEQRQRLGVAPLHVVQMQQERRGRRLQGVHDALIETLLLPALGHRSRRGAIGQQTGQETRELDLPEIVDDMLLCRAENLDYPWSG